MKKKFLISVSIPLFFVSITSMTTGAEDPRADLQEAKNALQKTLIHQDIYKQYDMMYVSGANVLIKSMDKILAGLGVATPDQPGLGSATPDQPAKAPTFSQAPQTHPMPDANTSNMTIEQRYDQLANKLPWLKDVEIANAFLSARIAFMASDNKNAQELIDIFKAFYEDRQSRSKISESKLERAEQLALLPDVVNYNFTSGNRLEVISLVHKLGITVNDIQKMPKLKNDLLQFWGRLYNSRASFSSQISRTETCITESFQRHKSTGAIYKPCL